MFRIKPTAIDRKIESVNKWNFISGREGIFLGMVINGHSSHSLTKQMWTSIELWFKQLQLPIKSSSCLIVFSWWGWSCNYPESWILGIGFSVSTALFGFILRWCLHLMFLKLMIEPKFWLLLLLNNDWNEYYISINYI